MAVPCGNRSLRSHADFTSFIGIGAMIDFVPCFPNPSLFLFGAGAQLKFFAAILLSTILDLT